MTLSKHGFVFAIIASLAVGSLLGVYIKAQAGAPQGASADNPAASVLVKNSLVNKAGMFLTNDGLYPYWALLPASNSSIARIVNLEATFPNLYPAWQELTNLVSCNEANNGEFLLLNWLQKDSGITMNTVFICNGTQWLNMGTPVAPLAPVGGSQH